MKVKRTICFRASQSVSVLPSLARARQKRGNCCLPSELLACRMRKLRRPIARLIWSRTLPSSAAFFKATRDLHVCARCVFHQQPADSAGVAARRCCAGSAALAVGICGLADEGPEINACSVDLPLRMSLHARRNALAQSLRTSPSCLGPCGVESRTWKCRAASFKPARATGCLSKAAASSRKRRA